jgi:hypothetical protein
MVATRSLRYARGKLAVKVKKWRGRPARESRASCACPIRTDQQSSLQVLDEEVYYGSIVTFALFAGS